MNKIALIIGVLFLSSCEMAQIKYGYYWNPVTVLSIAEEGIKENNLYKFSEVLSNSALCNYGTHEGMINLKKALEKVDFSSLNAPVKISSKYLSQPKWNGYYIYYQENYTATAQDLNGNPSLKINILCDFGDDLNSSRLLNAPKSSYKSVSCSINKIKNFKEDINNPVCN